MDATQSAGAYPLDMGGIQPDFLIAATYKWIAAPKGTVFLYTRPER
jgi:selenocysteine lyase/cysteine desulfurase